MLRHDLVSDESRGYSIIDSPSPKSPNTSALIVCDFDPGMLTAPLRLDGFTRNSTISVSGEFMRAFFS
jgi:hypothetical protein